jgi:phage shock protein PspC (stress-responsive transcriptional regulator)
MGRWGWRWDHGAIEPDTAPSPAPPPWRREPYARRRRARWWYGPRRRGRLRRSVGDRIVGGVAAGLAARFGLDPTVVRLGFVLATLVSGAGVPFYVLGWLLVPAEGESSSIAARAVRDGPGLALALAVLPALVVVLVLASALGAGWVSSFAAPVAVGCAGLVLVWRNASEEERRRVDPVLRPLAAVGVTGRASWRGALARGLVGTGVVVGGVSLLLMGSDRAVVRPLGGALLVVAGAVVVFGPWWLHVVRDLFDERQARARAEERADLAARVHDSVLQTLALIQRRADDPQQVTKLARAQERELRAWIFDGQAPGGSGDEPTLAGALRRLEREVEDLHEVAVETVVVGDCPLDDDLWALVAAGREAAVNAAKWSKAPTVSVFAEVEPGKVSMYVRDRGVGFDPATVGGDRRGLTESIRGRMARHGGSAELRSAPGEGTEVVLRMARRVPAVEAPGDG